MKPSQLAQILQGLQLAIEAAPEVIAIAESAQALVRNLGTAEVVTVQEQARLKAHLDAVQAAALAGNEPPHWTVEPDPV